MPETKKKMITKRFDRADERRDFKSHGHLDVLNFGEGVTVGRALFEPGWRWSSDVKPIAETETCEAAHIGYCVRGSMMIRMNDGEEYRIQAGDTFQIPPGHDAWVVGDATCELLDFGGFGQYAVPKQQAKAA